VSLGVCDRAEPGLAAEWAGVAAVEAVVEFEWA
jgi:hypothetical protein